MTRERTRKAGTDTRDKNGEDLAEFTWKMFRITLYLIAFIIVLGLGYAGYLWLLHALAG